MKIEFQATIITTLIALAFTTNTAFATPRRLRASKSSHRYANDHHPSGPHTITKTTSPKQQQQQRRRLTFSNNHHPHPQHPQQQHPTTTTVTNQKVCLKQHELPPSLGKGYRGKSGKGTPTTTWGCNNNSGTSSSNCESYGHHTYDALDSYYFPPTLVEKNCCCFEVCPLVQVVPTTGKFGMMMGGSRALSSTHTSPHHTQYHPTTTTNHYQYAYGGGGGGKSGGKGYGCGKGDRNCQSSCKIVCQCAPPPTPAPTLRPPNQPLITPRPTPSPTQAIDDIDQTLTFITVIPSHSPSNTPTHVPSLLPTQIPSTTPSTLSPTQQPILAIQAVVQTPSPTTSSPTTSPSHQPSSIPTQAPSVNPTQTPTTNPSQIPSDVPSLIPSANPTDTPSVYPSASPSTTPSAAPSAKPSVSPSATPSASPSITPSHTPSQLPSHAPSHVPSITPSNSPSFVPSNLPSSIPSTTPSTLTPSNNPSNFPSTTLPTSSPSQTPTIAPTPAILCPATELDNVLVDQDFENGQAPGWTNARIDSTEPNVFTTFLGRYNGDDTAFPSMTVSVPSGVMRLFVEFDFYEIDSFDGDGAGGTDSIGMNIVMGNGNNNNNQRMDEIDFGHFQYRFSEPSRSGVSSSGAIEWSIESDSIEESPQGGIARFTDQRHQMRVEIPSFFFASTAPSSSSSELTFTLTWSLQGELDEFVGFDNVRVVACVDQVPSAMPSSAPSLTPPPTPQPTPSPVENCLVSGQDCTNSITSCCPGTECIDFGGFTDAGDMNRFCVATTCREVGEPCGTLFDCCEETCDGGTCVNSLA